MARLAALLLVPLVRVFAFRARSHQAIAATGQKVPIVGSTPGVTKVVFMLDASKHMAIPNSVKSAMVTNVVEGLSAAVVVQAAVGSFGSKTANLLSGFTSDASTLKQQVLQSNSSFQGTVATVLPAMKLCKKMLPEQASGSVDMRFCLLIMDSGFMCGAPEATEKDELCEMFPDFCAEEPQRNDELSTCSDFATDEAGGVKFALAMSVKSEEDKQTRLANAAFRDFVTRTTGCDFKMSMDAVTSKDVIMADPDSCQRFIITSDVTELRTWTSNPLGNAKPSMPIVPSNPTRGSVPENGVSKNFMPTALFLIGAMASLC